MMKYHYYREPGMFFDLFRVFVMKLNFRPMWMNLVANLGYENEDIQHIVKYLKRFKDPKKELIIFFYLRDRNDNSYFSKIFVHIFEFYQEKMDLNSFLQYMEDEKRVCRELCQFYLDEDSDWQDLNRVSKAIEADEKIQNQEVKFHLLSFFIRPQYYLELLQEWFVNYYEVVKQIYEEEAERIQKTLDELDFELIQEGILSRSGKTIDMQSSLKLSLLLVNKNVVTGFEEYNWHILGCDYMRTLRNEINIQVAAAVFGDAVGDRHRVKIMEIILEEGEVSSSELARRLGMAMNSIYYHLDVLQKANLLCCHIQHKAAYYWLNTRVCEKAIDMIQNWIKAGGKEDETVEKTEYACI